MIKLRHRGSVEKEEMYEVAEEKSFFKEEDNFRSLLPFYRTMLNLLFRVAC